MIKINLNKKSIVIGWYLAAKMCNQNAVVDVNKKKTEIWADSMQHEMD